MKEKYTNIEKIIFFTLCIGLLICVIIFMEMALANRILVEGKIEILADNNIDNPLTIEAYRQSKIALLQNKKESRGLSSLVSERNIFAKSVGKKQGKIAAADHPILQVVDISHKALEIEYRGLIVFDNDSMVAQVNMYDNSYIVKTGSSVGDFKVESLNKNFIRLKDKKGKYLKIKFRKKTYTDELVAEIKELTSAYSKQVTKNSRFLDYKVLDIDEDSVLLSQKGQHLRLEKGMVHK